MLIQVAPQPIRWHPGGRSGSEIDRGSEELLEDTPTQEGTGAEAQRKSDDQSKEKRWDGRRTTMKGTAQAKEIGVEVQLAGTQSLQEPWTRKQP